jgi:hypothetical protein
MCELLINHMRILSEIVHKGSRKPELLEELEFYMSPQPLKMKAVDKFIRNVGYQEPCSSL